MSDAGALRFARYAYPPNELGYCGPEGARAMLVPGAEADIERRARHFDGAWVYLEFLADVLGTDDPLADDVVEAYWLGTDLVDRCSSRELFARLETRFVGQEGGTWREAAARAAAHHSFQVFEVYPWAAMLRRGLPPGPAVSVLDRCRVRTGRVLDVQGEWLRVTTRVLVWDDEHLVPGPPGTELARWSADGLALMEPPAPGDLISLHWDWVCDVIDPEQVARVEARERVQREAVGLG